MVTRTGSPNADTLLGTHGADLLSGRGGDDLLQPLSGPDRAYGGSGDDTIAFIDITGGTASGGSGTDTLKLTLGPGPSLFLDMQDGSASQSGSVPGHLTFTGMDRLILTSQADGDTVLGSAGNDDITYGGRGGVVHARGGDDLISYIPNLAATLDGGLGNDTLRVDAGTNVLYFIIDSFDGSVDDGQLSRIIGFETFDATGGTFADITAFGAGHDSFDGLAGNDTAFGGSGDDRLHGGDDADSLLGGDGNDLLLGGRQSDALFGGDGDDRLTGSKGQDVISGGLGRDTILFSPGADTVTGGRGADHFLLRVLDSDPDLITDFAADADQLRIAASLLPMPPPTGHLDPATIASGTPSGTAAQFVLTYDQTSDTSLLSWDADGTGTEFGPLALVRVTGQTFATGWDILIL